MFFEFLIDVLWIGIFHFGSYHIWHVFLSKHSNVLKDLFNIDVRYYDYNRESSTKNQHEILYTLASSTMIMCMVITPIIHSIMFVLIYNMIDIIQINKILLSIVCAKIFWFFNIRNKQCTMKPWKNIYETFLLFQFIFIAINYSNTTTIIPTLFQIIDESAYIENTLITMAKHYKSLFNSDSLLNTKITNLIVFTKTNKVLLSRIHIGVLSMIVFISIMYSQLKTTGEIIFYYYAAGRILQLTY